MQFLTFPFYDNAPSFAFGFCLTCLCTWLGTINFTYVNLILCWASNYYENITCLLEFEVPNGASFVVSVFHVL